MQVLGYFCELRVPVKVSIPEPLQCYSGLLHLHYLEVILNPWMVFHIEVSILKPFGMLILVSFMYE